jgi:cytochrome b
MTLHNAHPLWDLPTRVFHWLIVCCVLLAWWSAEQEYYEIHLWTGYTVLVLVMTRVIWGFIGSRHSRFADFLVGPRAALAYLRGRGERGLGHNPLGGWSVLLLLSLLLAQSVSGLFNSDDVLFSGPFYFWASDSFRDAMGVVHDVAFNALLAMIALHIFAVGFYQLRLREKLVQAMVRGSAAGREGSEAAVGWWWALLIAALFALLLWWVVSMAPQPVLLTW